VDGDEEEEALRNERPWLGPARENENENENEETKTKRKTAPPAPRPRRLCFFYALL